MKNTRNFSYDATGTLSATFATESLFGSITIPRQQNPAQRSSTQNDIAKPMTVQLVELVLVELVPVPVVPVPVVQALGELAAEASFNSGAIST